MTRIWNTAKKSAVLVAAMAAYVSAEAYDVDRTHLPLAEPDPPKFKELDVRNVEAPPLFRVEAPEGAPNVIIVLIDDVGFGATTPFGGPINTPTLDRLAEGGLRYNNFHTTALCSPTRACLLSGRNHHSVGMRFLSNVDTGFSKEEGERRGRTYTLSPADGLRRVGIEPDDVKDVIISHMHYDHAGNLDMFPNARFHIQTAEVAFGRLSCHSH